MFCLFFLRNDTKNLTAKWMLCRSSASDIFTWLPDTVRYTIQLDLDHRFHLIDFSQHSPFVVHQKRTLFSLIQTWARIYEICLIRNSKNKQTNKTDIILLGQLLDQLLTLVVFYCLFVCLFSSQMSWWGISTRLHIYFVHENRESQGTLV